MGCVRNKKVILCEDVIEERAEGLKASSRKVPLKKKLQGQSQENLVHEIMCDTTQTVYM